MRREVLWTQAAVEQLAQLASRNSRQSTRILVAVREFGRVSRGDLKKLTGSEEWRLRAGDWRVILVLESERAYVFRISDRQDAY
jgi:mRNA-degrading endonuclease RelE of RelBE toxin-antitoxin system